MDWSGVRTLPAGQERQLSRVPAVKATGMLTLDLTTQMPELIHRVVIYLRVLACAWHRDGDSLPGAWPACGFLLLVRAGSGEVALLVAGRSGARSCASRSC
jgi:hypothetical protein